MFYGWRIVAVAFLCHCVTTGIVFYSFGVFLAPLAAEFGSHGRVALAFSAVALLGAVYSPPVGRLVDRYGPRGVQLAGAALLGTGLAVLGTVTSLVQLYAVMGLCVSLGSTALGNLPCNTAVATWFVRRRGQALGIATAGISMGGVVFVPLTQALIEAGGWRRGFMVLGALVLVVVLPPVALVMRRAPEDLGLRPDGAEPPPGHPDHDLLRRELERSLTPAQAVRDRNFWLVAIGFGLTVMSLSAVLLYQIPMLVDQGFSPAHASWALGSTAGMGVIGKLGFGYLLDRFDQRRVTLACFLLQAVGLVLLGLIGHGLPLLVAYVVLYGYAMGGNATLQATIIGACFGRLHYGAIAGRMAPLLVTAQATGVPLLGYLRDRTGSYVEGLAAALVATLMAAGCLAAVRLPAQR